MKAILCATVDEARSVRDQLDRVYGYPKAGVSASSGQPTPPGSPGWTASIGDIVDIGGAALLVGPSAAEAAIVGRVLVESPVSYGTTYSVSISGWNGDAPILSESSIVCRPTSLDDLSIVKAMSIQIIAVRSAASRAAGFLHTDGKRYTLEHDACRQIMEAHAWAEYDAANGTSHMRYPLVWPSVDRTGFVAMASLADVTSFALAYSLADRALTEQMAGLEMSIALAETVDDVNRILGAV